MLAAGESVPAIGRSDEEEDGNANKKGRIPEEEAGEKELDGLNGNQDSEVTEEKKTEGLDPNRGWKRKRQDDENGNEGSGNNQNSEGNGSGNQESGGGEDGENDENQEDDFKEEEEEEERIRRAAEKGKQPMSCKCEPMEREFLKMEHGESSNPPEDELPTDIEDHWDLAILKSMWNFKNMNGNLPDTPSDKLLKHILFSNPNFKLPKEYLKMKIIEFHSNFEDVIQMDGPNPEMTRTIAREVFHLCKLLWGNQQQQRLQWVQRGYVDGSFRCPSSHIIIAGKDNPEIDPHHAQWIQQDQLILSLLISSISEETLPIVIGLATSKQVWDALKKALSSPSNTRIFNLHMSLQNLKQDDLPVTQYLQKAKLISDELAAVGRPLCLADLNIYIFKGLHSDFKDLVTALSARPQPVTYSELHINDPTPPTIALKIIPPIIVVVEETLKEEVVVSHPLEIIRIVNLGSRLLTAKLAAKYAPIPLTQSWFPDTGATQHITPDLSDIHQAEPYKGVDQLQVGNGAGLPIHHTGNSLFH
ncbi:hypothetical protein KY285_025519 [Solanum tuberosum]|nr:hypothetical protein KY289_024396 [Solanum tuberosum]KAH0677718.1 hypothetical protein KY285_025519 [Solanum tuberosum]